MEQKLVRVPFDLELAKKITNKEIEGRIVTRGGRSVRVICWDKKSDSIYNIVALLDESIMERILTYTIGGSEVAEEERNNDLMLEIPEYSTFKDGDIIAFGDKHTFIGIFNCAWSYNGSHSDYVVLNHENRLLFNGDAWTYKNARFATEEEEQKLIDALKASKETKAKEYLKRFFGIEGKPECGFKPFDKVLVRTYSDMDIWTCDIYSHSLQDGDGNFNNVCIGGVWSECIPYNNETMHLLGTNDDWNGNMNKKDHASLESAKLLKEKNLDVKDKPKEIGYCKIHRIFLYNNEMCDECIIKCKYSKGEKRNYLI